MIAFNLNDLLKALSLNAIILGVILQHMNLRGRGRHNSVRNNPSASYFPSIYGNILASVFTFSFLTSILFAHGLMSFFQFIYYFFFFNLEFWKGKKINMFGHFSMCNCISPGRRYQLVK